MADLTREQKLTLLSQDRKFFINTLLSNNFADVKAKLLALGYPVSTPQQAYTLIDGFFKTGNKGALFSVANVPYINNSGNDTAGLQAPPDANFKTTFFSFIPYVGDLLDNAIDGTTTTPTDPATALAQQQLLLQQQQQAQQAANAADTKQTFIYFGIVILFLAAVFGAISIWRSSKKKKD